MSPFLHLNPGQSSDGVLSGLLVHQSGISLQLDTRFRPPTTATQHRLDFLLGAPVEVAHNSKCLAPSAFLFDSPGEDLELASLTGCTAPGFDERPVDADRQVLNRLRVGLRMINLFAKFLFHSLAESERPIAVGRRSQATCFRQQLAQKSGGPGVCEFGGKFGLQVTKLGSGAFRQQPAQWRYYAIVATGLTSVKSGCVHHDAPQCSI